METMLFVLWIYFPNAWTFGPLPMTPGWYGGFVFDAAEDCHAVAQQAPTRMVCRPATAPMPTGLARHERKGPQSERLKGGLSE